MPSLKMIMATDLFHRSWQCTSMDGEAELCRSSVDSLASTGRLVPGVADASWILLRLPLELFRTRILVFLCALFICLDNT